MTDLPSSLCDAATVVLTTAAPTAKARETHRFAAAWRGGAIAEIGSAEPPERPARPARPALLPPRELPRRRIGPAPEGRIALLHAIAHIELNAIDLAWDLIARFGPALSRAACDDWVRVADEEARHFGLLASMELTMGITCQSSKSRPSTRAGPWFAERKAGSCCSSRS